MQEIRSQDNQKLKEFAALCRDKKQRDSRSLCVMDGIKLCRDAAGAGHEIVQLWVTETACGKYSAEIEELERSAAEAYLIRDSAARKLSETVTPQGVMASVKRPDFCDVGDVADEDRVLGLCGVQNPENVGGAIRTAVALGYRAVVLSPDCADPWSPRAVRAGAGTQLSCRICRADDFASAVSGLREAGFSAYASAIHRDSVPVTEVAKDGKIFLAVGSEGRGLPDEVIESCAQTVHIPMDPAAESMNAAAAAAVMMWELRKNSK